MPATTFHPRWSCISGGIKTGVKNGNFAIAQTVALKRRETRQRSYATWSPSNQPTRVAILGGGLTGLTAAYYLTRYLPRSDITLYESSDRLGGWIDTVEEQVTLADGSSGTVLFERGARTVQAQNSQPKYDDMVFYDLVARLGLGKELVCTRKTDGINRYIYYPDHLVDVTGPVLDPFRRPAQTAASVLRLVSDVLTEPLYKEAIPSVLRMLTLGRRSGREMAGQCADVSVGKWFAQKFGRRDLVDNVLSAMVHGIYGGDVWQLSMRSSGPFSRMWRLDQFDRLSRGEIAMNLADYRLMELMIGSSKPTADLAKEAMKFGYMSFRHGFRTLTEALQSALRETAKVTIKMNEPVTRLECADMETISLSSRNAQKPVQFDKVISTILAQDLAAIAPGLPSLASSKATTISLVNLWYPTANLNAPHHGFGYLIPQSIPSEQNPECALGVLFDSDREKLMPTAAQPASAASEPYLGGTKLTVMLGGHMQPTPPPVHESIAAAKTVVARHLRIPPAEAARAVASAKLCTACIPQLEVGHPLRMSRAHGELQDVYRGRLAVCGQSYQPPGVLTSLRAAHDLVSHMAGLLAPPESSQSSQSSGFSALEPSTPGDTGLARFVQEELWVKVEKARLPYRWHSTDDKMDLELKPLK